MRKDLINKNVEAMNVSEVRKMFEMSKNIKDPINMTIGMPDFEVPKEVKQAAIDAIQQNKNNYSLTTGIDELKDEIVRKLKQKNNILAKKEDVIITNAVSGGLSIILTTILNPGDEVLIIEPYFVGYKQLVTQNGAKPVFCKTNDDFSLDLQEIEHNLTKKTKAMILNTPNNPTGRVYSENELNHLADIAKKHDLIIISDEIYEDFVYEKPHFSIGSVYENTISMFGFSKSHAMTGWRIGYIVGPQEIISQAIKVQQFNFVCAPTPFQYAGIKAINTDISKHIADYQKKRDIIYEGLKDDYDIQRSEGAFYFYIKYPYDAELFMKRCLENKLLIVSGIAFSENNTHFRLSFANNDKTLKAAVEVLKKISRE